MRKYLLLIAIIFPFHLIAQKVKTVEGEYTYHVPENISLNEAKRTALERAQIQALANEFGTIVSQDNTTRIENRNGKSHTDFISISGSDMKGEWLETIGTPKYVVFYEGEQLIISCQVKGKAREILLSTIDYQAHILCNGTEERFESDRFKDGDALYLSFQSPAKGFLAVYLLDAENHVSCLLPYRNQQSGIYPIEGNRQYLFFNRDTALGEDRSTVDEYYMTCDRISEYNQFYIIFSPNEFTKAADKASLSNSPRQLPFKDFQKWLTKCRKLDNKMTVKKIGITVEK